MKHISHTLSLSLLSFVLSCTNDLHAQPCSFPGEPDASTRKIALMKVYEGFSKPVAMIFVPNSEGNFYVVEQAGQIKLQVGTARRLALDIRDRVNADGSELGLLGLALHPNFIKNRLLYVNYNPRGALRTRISEFPVAEDGSIQKNAERIILEFVQPYSNHNGGTIVFGPDGYLYIGNGDGGSANDPQNHGQNLNSLLGKMLRIDVDKREGNLQYAIPRDNPFWGRLNTRSEIFATGLRNPWKFSFDRATGKLWAGDVGQNLLEEIDVIAKGANYGWKVMEGDQCRGGGNNCNRQGLTLPVAVYPRSEGVSVTGGHVYRGARFPDMVGTYFYGDYATGVIWGLSADSLTPKPTKLLATQHAISSFAEDLQGELYVLDHNGSILRIDQNTQQQPSNNFPKTLSETKCFSRLNPLEPIAGMYPLAVNAPLWSDGAAKSRFVYLPQGQQARFSAQGSWQLPVGGVLLKNFYVTVASENGTQTKIIESRFLVRKSDGIKSYSYRWNETQDEANLVQGAMLRPLKVVDGNNAEVSYQHYYPSASDCGRCHVAGKSDFLAFNTLQANRTIVVDGVEVNQISWFKGKGILAAEGIPENPSTDLPALVDPSLNTATLEKRVRSWLHVQCASCHQLGGITQARFDVRYPIAFKETGLCNAEPLAGNLGIEGAKILSPNDTQRSLLVLRTRALDPLQRMPPLASARRDELGVMLLEQWVPTITTCP